MAVKMYLDGTARSKFNQLSMSLVNRTPLVKKQLCVGIFPYEGFFIAFDNRCGTLNFFGFKDRLDALECIGVKPS